eukprot:scaffold171_cov284-Chaetoceros_neogracile.AAC.4
MRLDESADTSPLVRAMVDPIAAVCTVSIYIRGSSIIRFCIFGYSTFDWSSNLLYPLSPQQALNADIV